MSRSMILFVLLVLSAPLLQGQEKGYKVVRPDGSVEFTDRPAAGAKEIVLPKSQTYEAPSVRTTEPANGEPSAEKAPSPYTRLAITSPAQEETIRDTGGIVSIAVALEPGLQAAHTLVIMLDGKEAARGTGGSFALTEIERGSHTVAAEVRDASNGAVKRSDPVTFFVLQRSLLHKTTP